MNKNMVSRIAELKLAKDNISSLIYFNENISIETSIMLFDEFGLTKDDVNFFIKNYKNIGIIFNLRRENQEFNENWAEFIYETFPNKKPTSKFDNIFFSKNYDEVLLITTKRLLEVDLKKLNEKINAINDKIAENNLIKEREKILITRLPRIFGKIREFFSK